MSSRTAEFASAILIGVTVGVFAGAYLITMPYAESDDCLTKPTGDTLQGQHWYYRIERGSKRHCWYLRGEAEKSSRAASSGKTSNTASRTQDSTSQHSIADAHAELRSRARIEDNTSTVAAHPGSSSIVAVAAMNTPVVDDSSASNVISRWPDPVVADSSATPQPGTAETAVVADAQQPDPTPADPAAAAPALADATAAADQQEAGPSILNAPGRYSGSLQELLIVAFAALALAGLTGSGVYRLAGGRRTKQRYQASRRSSDWQQPKKNKNARKAQRIEPQPAAMDVESFGPETKYAPEPQYAPAFVHEPEPDYTQPSEPDYADPEYASELEYAPKPEYEPEYRQYDAPHPQFASQRGYANADHANYEPVNCEPVSEYAPKPRNRGMQSRELDESYESIEQLLIRLAS